MLRGLENIGLLLLQTRTSNDRIRRSIRRLTGEDLPLMPNTATGSDPSLLWLGPNRWLIVSARGALRAVQLRLQNALADHTCLLADVSDSRCVIEVGGRDARTLLARVCALDLSTGNFETGDCAQTLLVRIPLLLHQVDVRPGFRLYVDRSLAHYAWAWLSDAADGLGGRLTT